MEFNAKNVGEKLSIIVKNEDIRNYAKDGVLSLIQAIFEGDFFEGLSAIKNSKDIIFNIPTILFWEKMQQFLLNTFDDFEEQVKMIAKFEETYGEYSDFVKTQMHIIDKINDDKKIKYYANLTRSLLLNNIPLTLYYKLVQIMDSCTVDELEFIKTRKLKRLDYDIRIFSLKILGLVEQDQEDDKVFFVFTSLATALINYALADDLNNEPIHRYEDLVPPDPVSYATDDDINALFPDE